jgi:hypothetical protein
MRFGKSIIREGLQAFDDSARYNILGAGFLILSRSRLSVSSESDKIAERTAMRER